MARASWPVALAFVAGCAPIGAKPDRIAVSSEPPGADIYVMDAKLGVTPGSVPLGAIFPSTYPAEHRRLYGTIELRKPGCVPATQPVSTRGVARGVHVKLDCGQATAVGTGTGPEPPQPPPAASPATHAEQRLRQVREWLDQGLITEEEAREVRRRILGDL